MHGRAARHLTSYRVLDVSSPSRSRLEQARSLGWADPPRGILLLCNLSSNSSRSPCQVLVLQTRMAITAACNDLIKFVEIKYDDPDFLTGGKAWKATMWTRKISWSNWVERSRLTLKKSRLTKAILLCCLCCGMMRPSNHAAAEETDFLCPDSEHAQ